MATLIQLSRWLLAVMVVALALGGCSKHQTAQATAEQLQKSFEKADASLKQQVVEASTAFQASNYTQAIITMDRVVQTQPIDEAQKKAVDALIVQTRQAVQQNPKLDSPQLYKAMSDLMERVHGEN
ncbi:MAG: hypothetical protein HY298_18960 [Verrucomicrobia bacterium]|nr:hypothetical protein [Verrucomicrobiota bacterium]